MGSKTKHSIWCGETGAQGGGNNKYYKNWEDCPYCTDEERPVLLPVTLEDLKPVCGKDNCLECSHAVREDRNFNRSCSFPYNSSRSLEKHGNGEFIESVYGVSKTHIKLIEPAKTVCDNFIKWDKSKARIIDYTRIHTKNRP